MSGSAASSTTMGLGIDSDPLARAAETLRRNARRERFEAEAAEDLARRCSGDAAEGSPASLGEPVVGRSRELFRPFVRLRGPPDPAVVRQEDVLRASLEALMSPERRPSGGWQAVREQLWSIRQDMLVQHLHRGEFAAQVSLACARLSVDAGDISELHRGLAPLVAGGACASRVRRMWPPERRDEVAGLRLIFLTHGGIEGSPGRLEGELLQHLQEHGAVGAQGSALHFALQLHAARVSGNFTRHLQLVRRGLKRTSGAKADEAQRAQSSSEKLARLLAPPIRRTGLQSLSQAFPQGLSVSRAMALLGFSRGVDDFEQWLAQELDVQLEHVRRHCIVDDSRLVTSCVSARLEEQARAAAALARQRARELDGAASSTMVSHTLVPSAARAEGLAPIWFELRHGSTEMRVAAFVASHAEIIRKMSADGGSKKALKKQAKRDKKQLKKALKKERKKAKGEAKKQKKAEKKLHKASKNDAKQERKRARLESTREQVTVVIAAVPQKGGVVSSSGSDSLASEESVSSECCTSDEA